MKSVFQAASVATLCLLAAIVSADVLKPSTIITKQSLKQWGYRPIQKVYYRVDYCDPGIRQKANVAFQTIKSIKSLKGQTGTYYRYTLILEHYPEAAQASERVKELRAPARASIMHSKSCGMRIAVVQNKSVYIVHTDVAMFRHQEMKAVLARFVKTHSAKRLAK